MRDPINLKRVQIDNVELEILVIPNLPEYDIQDYDVFNEKDFKKYLQDVEKACRNSYEYKQMVKYLRENMDMNKCSFYENVNNIDTFNIKIHIHHEPLTLYDICLIVYNKRMSNNESIDIEMVAKEVMFLHYKLLVGLIPLAETPHELVHNQYLFVPADMVLGNYLKFVDMYEEYMTSEQIYVLNSILDATKIYNGSDLNVLTKKYIYIDVSGAYKLPELSVISDLISSKIVEIKDSLNNINSNEGKEIIPISFIKEKEND